MHPMSKFAFGVLKPLASARAACRPPGLGPPTCAHAEPDCIVGPRASVALYQLLAVCLAAHLTEWVFLRPLTPEPRL